MNKPKSDSDSWINALIWFALSNKALVALFVLVILFCGFSFAPFDWKIGGPFRFPISVDAIPDIGENQQIVFTEWAGRSPQDIEEQISYPLTCALLGIPEVKTVRSYSMFGFSTIYVIFTDDVDFYWSRSRLLEKLNSLPPRTLPEGVQPSLGPDATALGQIFAYTLEGQDAEGKPTGGWDLHELRSIQDWYIRYALLAAEGISEVASVGGFVQEYQIDVDPDLLRAHDVNIDEVVGAVNKSNVDVGARNIEVNKVEYVIRGLGFAKSVEDFENALIKLNNGIPIFVKNVAHVSLGPSSRSGALDKGGNEAVGGVVVVRYGKNPLTAIKSVKAKINEIADSLPQKTLPNGMSSQVTIVPFYDRTGLIYETLATLQSALTDEILLTVIVILIMVRSLASSLLISLTLPLSILFCFICMKLFRVEANIVALSGIAIAIGTVVDMGIIVTENILKHLEQKNSDEQGLVLVYNAVSEVGGAVVTAVSTTIISFLPVFLLGGPEGKLFRPLAFTKTFTLFASAILALVVLPPLAHAFLINTKRSSQRAWVFHEASVYLGGLLAFFFNFWLGFLVALIGALRLAARWAPGYWRQRMPRVTTWLIVACFLILLANHWAPLGPGQGGIANSLVVVLFVGGILAFLGIFKRNYAHVLGWCLVHKRTFLALPTSMLLLGIVIWHGFAGLFGWLPNLIIKSPPFIYMADKFPGLGKEFMPPLDEGSFLYMPVTMPHASIGEVLDIIKKQDQAIEKIPEVETAVGKLGRVESALDPAPISMIETVINYRSKYLRDQDGNLLTFQFLANESDLFRDENGRILPAPDGKPYLVQGRFVRDQAGRLIPDPIGRPFRLWRDALLPKLNPGRSAWKGIQKPDDIWEFVIAAATIPGVTVAPKLQPISARLVMLQSGIRASMGVRVKGPDFHTVQESCLALERALRQVPSVEPQTVIADRIIGKPYIEIEVDRLAIAQYGIDLQKVQNVIETALGGKPITTTVEGRERYPVRVRYMRELRDDLDALGKILVPGPNQSQVPLEQLTTVRYVRGPQVIKGEDSFQVGYVTFDKKPGHAEVEVVDQARKLLSEQIAGGDLVLPSGVSFAFTGTYESQLRSEEKLKVLIPVVFAIIFSIIYLQFRSSAITLLVLSGVTVAWAGGFIMIWLYGQPWFLNFSIADHNLRDILQIHPVYLSVAIWVGFLALFGIADDDGVVMATYLEERFSRETMTSVEQIRRATIEAGERRVRPCLMTTATTILALLPVLTSSGRGADIMIPMAIPSFGGMVLVVMTMLIVPVLYCTIKEHHLSKTSKWLD